MRFANTDWHLADQHNKIQTWEQVGIAVMLNDGELEMHEVKGFMRDDAAVKIKVAADMYPMFVFKLVKKNGHGWETKIVGTK